MNLKAVQVEENSREAATLQIITKRLHMKKICDHEEFDRIMRDGWNLEQMEHAEVRRGV